MKDIEIIVDDSNIFGYVGSSSDDSSFNYFRAFYTEDQVAALKAWLQEQNIFEFAVLRNIYIDESQRGIGLGKRLVTQFLLKTNQIPTLLIASPDEDNFDLVSWYINQDFIMTKFISEDGPIMIKYN